MKMVITLDLDNAAFEDSYEARRVLEQFARNVEDYITGPRSKLMDLNGNSCGTVEIIKD